MCILLCVSGIIDSLIGAANDREDVAQKAIFKSLVDIGRKKFSIVLNISHDFLVKHSKVLRSLHC